MNRIYLAIPIISLFALLKLYFCYFLYKKIEQFYSISNYPIIGKKQFPMVDIVKKYFKFQGTYENTISSAMQLCVYFCFNSILLSKNFLSLNTMFFPYIILFQFSLFFFKDSKHPEFLIKKIVFNNIIIVSSFLTFYSINHYSQIEGSDAFKYVFLFLVVINILIIINSQSFYIGRLDNILFNILMINFFSYTYCYNFLDYQYLDNYSLILLSEILTFALLVLKKNLEFYRYRTYSLFRQKRLHPLFLGMILIFCAKVF